MDEIDREENIYKVNNCYLEKRKKHWQVVPKTYC